MPLPLVVAYAIAAIGGAAATAVVVVSVDMIINWWKGKKLAVLGQREVGKTVLINYLTTGVLSTDYSQTTEERKTKRNKLKMGDLALRIKRSKDVPGAQVDYPRWKEIHKSSDLTLYLFRADLVLADDSDVLQRIEDDLGQIRRWRAEDHPLYLIGTHCDLDPKYKKYFPDKIGDYRDRLAKRMGRALQLSNHAPMIVGSLRSEETTQDVVRSLLHSLPN
jgi:hypothetical protein